MNPSSSSESSSLGGKQPSLRRSLSTPLLCCGGSTAAEFCGGTTAGCAALCCCAPCTVVSLLVFAVYKVPRGICRRGIRRMRRRRRGRRAKKTDVLDDGDCGKRLCKVGSSQFAIHPLESKDDGELDKFAMYMSEDEEEDELIALEKEMWNRFNSGGFWRSTSQAETTSSSRTD